VNFRDTRARRRTDPTLEMTPLIDVVFLLLIFFLITTTFVRPDESQLPLNLPSASAGESSTPGERVVIFVTADGSLQLQDELVRPEEVYQRLERLYAEEPGLQLQVKGDKDTSYGYVTGVIDMARQVGFKRVNLVVQRKR
jgi:biopolymer transport protein ExbD